MGRMACRRHLVTGCDHLSLVQHFMNRAQVLAHLRARDLAGNEKDRRGASVGSGKAGGGIVDGYARDNQRHAGLPRRPCVAVGHMRGAVLMPCGDVPDGRLVPHCDDAAGHVYAGDPEYDLDSLAHQRLRKGFTTTHERHGRLHFTAWPTERRPWVYSVRTPRRADDSLRLNVRRVAGSISTYRFTEPSKFGEGNWYSAPECAAREYAFPGSYLSVQNPPRRCWALRSRRGSSVHPKLPPHDGHHVRNEEL